MFGPSGWELAIIGVAAYVAVTALVRMMSGRQNALINDLERQAEAERERNRQREQRKKRRRIRSELRRSRAEDTS